MSGVPYAALPPDLRTLLRAHAAAGGRPHIARHVIGCRLTQETRVLSSVDDDDVRAVCARPCAAVLARSVDLGALAAFARETDFDLGAFLVDEVGCCHSQRPAPCSMRLVSAFGNSSMMN